MASARKRSATPMLVGLLVATVLAIGLSIFWQRAPRDLAGQASTVIAKNCAGGQRIDNSSEIAAGLSGYLTKASAGAKVSSSDIGIVTSKLKPDGVGLEFYRTYTKCLQDGAESYLRLKGVHVVTPQTPTQEQSSEAAAENNRLPLATDAGGTKKATPHTGSGRSVDRGGKQRIEAISTNQSGGITAGQIGSLNIEEKR